MKFLILGLLGASLRASDEPSNVDLGNLLVAGAMVAAATYRGGA